MPIDISTLWDFAKPELSEERFRAALSTASVDDALLLQTQIARTYGIRGNFSQAQQILSNIEPQIQSASSGTRVHYYLELGRTYCSATHPAETQTTEIKELARFAYTKAFELAQKENLASLAIDALHMMTFVDTALEEQLEWNRKAIALVQSSSQKDARKWEGSLYNNTGYTLYLIGNYEEALSEFQLALAAHERGGNPQTIRIAKWMIAWTFRALNRLDEAIKIQLQLELECDGAGEPDSYVFEELELLYKALNIDEKAKFYAARRKAAMPPE